MSNVAQCNFYVVQIILLTDTGIKIPLIILFRTWEKRDYAPSLSGNNNAQMYSRISLKYYSLVERAGYPSRELYRRKYFAHQSSNLFTLYIFPSENDYLKKKHILLLIYITNFPSQNYVTYLRDVLINKMSYYYTKDGFYRKNRREQHGVIKIWNEIKHSYFISGITIVETKEINFISEVEIQYFHIASSII